MTRKPPGGTQSPVENTGRHRPGRRPLRRPPEPGHPGATAMGITSPAPQPGMNAGPAEPVPVAFIGRTSTLVMQDPSASMRRQVRESQAKLPPGFFISRHYSDIKSRRLAISERGHGSEHAQFTAVGSPPHSELAEPPTQAAWPT